MHCGAPNTATVGQTLVAPAGATALTAFSFRLRDSLNGGALPFTAYVRAWDGTKATGPVLWSAPRSAATVTVDGGQPVYTFTQGSLLVTPGTAYVLYLSLSEFIGANPAVEGSLIAEITWGNSPAAGHGFVSINNGADVGKLTSEPWSVPSDTEANYSATFGGP
jgi:hypothetical protein